MRLEEIFESKDDDNEEDTTKKPVIVFGGRFQPFHRGHYQVYLWLCKKFGKGNVWIATSNKTNYDENDGPISPFTFEEKQEIITGLYGIEARRIVKCKNPAFSPKEVFKLYKGFDLVYVAAAGKKDEDRYKKSEYFLPVPHHMKLPRDVDQLLSLDEGKSYYVTVPMKRDNISGTEARQALIDAHEDDFKKTFLHYFGRWDDTIAEMIIARLKEMK